MKNLTVENIVKACDGTLYGKEFMKNCKEEAEGVVLDSRLLQENYVFIATRGEKVDGHKFIPSVFEKVPWLLSVRNFRKHLAVPVFW